MKFGFTARVIEVLEPALAVTPDDPQLLAMLGGALIEVRKHSEGIAYLEKAVSLDPDDGRIRVQRALGRLASARCAPLGNDNPIWPPL